MNRNAIVLAVPSRDGLTQARYQVRKYLGWLEVKELLKDQPLEDNREKRLSERVCDKSPLPLGEG